MSFKHGREKHLLLLVEDHRIWTFPIGEQDSLDSESLLFYREDRLGKKIIGYKNVPGAKL
jgi:ABC-type cobalt transport system substrate-binding protein